VNFNGTGTVAIRGSGNVSSITDGGTGDYTINFTTAMQDANYALVNGSVLTGTSRIIGHAGQTFSALAASCRVTMYSTTNTTAGATQLADPDFCLFSFFR
jgi:hypothetical protein